MNTLYSDFIQKHLDILSFRDLAPETISTYISYLDEFLCWTEKELSGKSLSDVSFEEIRLLFTPFTVTWSKSISNHLR